MKKAISLIIIGAILLSIGVGIFLSERSQQVIIGYKYGLPSMPQYRTIPPSGALLGAAVGISILGSSLVISGTVRLVKRR